ncbi:MAG: ABC transporter permease [Akkermansia muciniphila]
MAEDKTGIERTRSRFRTAAVIYTKELRSYFCTPFGWVILACTMGLEGFWLQTAIKAMSSPTSEGVMYHMLNNINFWFYFIFIFPLITMRTFAEEERMGTMEGLLTAPVTTTQVVLSKYLACFTFYLVLWAPMLLYPQMSDIANTYTHIRYGIETLGTGMDVEAVGRIEYHLADWIGPYCILTLLGMFFIALGMFCSALTRSQIIAGIFCTCLMISYYFMGRVTELWGEFPAAPVFHYISCTEQINAFSQGLLDTRPLVLYGTLAVLMLYLTKLVVDYRRWNS